MSEVADAACADEAEVDPERAPAEAAAPGQAPPGPEQHAGPAAHTTRPDHPKKPRKHKHHAEVVHATPGRVRLKVPGAKGNLTLLNQMRSSFEGVPGIDLVNVKPESGSLVIHYDAAHYPNIASLFLHLNTNTEAPAELRHPTGPQPHRPPTTELDEKINAITEEAEFLADHSHFARTIVSSIKALDRTIKRTTNNNVDLKILAPVGLAGFTFLEIGAAAATPMWVTLVIFSVNHFVELQAHNIREADPSLPGKRQG